MTERVDFFAKLIDLMSTLRSSQGCPWDREQTRETLKPMLIEESHEVLEALDRDDPDHLCEELGDLLFQIVFHCQIAKEKGEFDAYDVCSRLHKKMVRRHPHVFGDASISDSQELLRKWEDIKAAEKAAAGREEKRHSLLDGIPDSLPAIYKTYQMTAKASRVGFDWHDLDGIRAKFLEEFDELKEAISSLDARSIKEEVGDLVFVVLNIARYLEVDPETALKGTNSKFARRFRGMEQSFSDRGRSLKDASLDEMEEVWQDQKEGQTRS